MQNNTIEKLYSAFTKKPPIPAPHPASEPERGFKKKTSQYVPHYKIWEAGEWYTRTNVYPEKMVRKIVVNLSYYFYIGHPEAGIPPCRTYATRRARIMECINRAFPAGDWANTPEKLFYISRIVDRVSRWSPPRRKGQQALWEDNKCPGLTQVPGQDRQITAIFKAYRFCLSYRQEHETLPTAYAIRKLNGTRLDTGKLVLDDFPFLEKTLGSHPMASLSKQEHEDLRRYYFKCAKKLKFRTKHSEGV